MSCLSEWAWQCLNKTLFTKTGGGLDMAYMGYGLPIRILGYFLHFRDEGISSVRVKVVLLRSHVNRG